MADVSLLPKIRVTGEKEKDAKPGSLERVDTGASVRKDVPSGKLTSKLRNAGNGKDGSETATLSGGDARKSGEGELPPIDPLSQQILKRTNTSNLQRYKSQPPAEPTGQTPMSSSDAQSEAKAGMARDIHSSIYRADKKKGVSFLSRFSLIGSNKKKPFLDGTMDSHGSEVGDDRLEGMDAQLFTHHVDNFGYNPKQPTPPAYIKVRARFKKEREFNHLFLAQELRSRTAKGEGANPAHQSGAAASHNPVWAAEFSKDGKFLACAGQDRVVRVWAVLSTAEERRAHETIEAERRASGGESTHLSAPVFHQKPYREFAGHSATILDLSWSKNNFLLSSSMDKTVRLWHLSRNENLCTFKHADFVPSIQFHPRDDRFFLAGSLDTKLRLWSIPDKSVAYWTQLPDMITSVAFTPDGKTCIAGTLSGLCMFYDTEGLKYQSQIHVKSTRGQNAKGSKITGIQAKAFPKAPGQEKEDVKILVTSNDSRIRVYNLRDKSLEMKFRAHENACSQIRATFADDTAHVICGSEDRKAYIWDMTEAIEGEKRNHRPVEMFEAHGSITTCAIMAPLKTRQLLSASEDPIFDLCNPPPVTLMSREQSMNSGSKPPTDGGGSTPNSAVPTPADPSFTKVAESPAYIARSAHTDGNIIVTTDYTGSIKVFRQDCAYTKRLRFDNWDTASIFSKRTSSKFEGIGRTSSITSRGGGRSRRDSTSTQPPNERIMHWRQELSHGNFEGFGGAVTSRRSVASVGRSVSPRKRNNRISVGSVSSRLGDTGGGPGEKLEGHHPYTYSHSTNAVSSRPSASLSTSASNLSTPFSSSTPPSITTSLTSPSLSASMPPPALPTAPKLQLPNHTSPDPPLYPPRTPTTTTPTTTKSAESVQKEDAESSSSLFDPIARQITSSNPLNIYNGQSWAFWGLSAMRMALRWKNSDEVSGEDQAKVEKREDANGPEDVDGGERREEGVDGGLGLGLGLGLRPELVQRDSFASNVSVLTSEMESCGSDGDEVDGVEGVCRKCGKRRPGRVCMECGFGGM